jgi:hypothetical protein
MTEFSKKSQETRQHLVETYAFTVAELVALDQHLLAQDRAEALEAKNLTKLAQGERTLAHRWWRGLKFAAPSAQRRSGRPSDTGWSAKRAVMPIKAPGR